MSRPSPAEVRAGGQPPGVTGRRNEEHWAGRLYMRALSPYVSWLFVRAGASANAVTGLMIVCGVLAGVVVAFGGLATALAAAVLVQVYLLLDCADGEVARYTGRTSATGVFLDRIGHYFAEAALLVGLGLRAQGEWTVAGGYVTAGLAAALGAVLIKAETDLVVVARAKSGLTGVLADGDLAPRGPGLARARGLASAVRFHRVVQAVELSLLIVLFAIVDGVRGDLVATRVLALACLLIAALQLLLHLVSILASRRLR